ncbi:two-component system, OmpR family, sensor kinase [Rhizobiaceae bacterium]|nr:two-component system, OmpR family, sensor kinase [Rhizobiaceae bacterium]
MTSIRRALLLPLAGGLALALVAATLATYVRARDEASAMFDVQLSQLAASVTGMPLSVAPGAGRAGSADAPLIVQVWNRDGVQVYRSQGAREAPARGSPGFATVQTRDGPWRVYSVLAGGELVQVAQPLALRDQLAASLALSTIVPWLVAAPLIAVLLWFAIARALRPLDRLAHAVGERNPRELEPLSEREWPREVAPLVAALNGLLRRLDGALDAQKAFVADAAHELRTPLAAVHLQAELAERAHGEAERAGALAALRGGLMRATRVVEQLLSLAREDHAGADAPRVHVDLAALAREAIAAHAGRAAAKDVDLGAGRLDTLAVDGDADALATLAANLIDNALRYVPAGGHVDVIVETRDGAPALVVRDDGPGIPASERALVFERFARGPRRGAPGSGLGLAIVKRIAERHGAAVTLADGAHGRGLEVVVRFGQVASGDERGERGPRTGDRAGGTAMPGT